MAREVNLGSIIGPQGPKGEIGSTGATGPKGMDGATWLSGSANPTVQGANGDYFINTETCDIYKKLSGAWSKVGNIKGATGATGAIGLQGPKGDKGDKGDAFSIAKAYTSIIDMNAGYASDGVKQGQFVVIDTGNVEDADNAKLYVKGTASYTYVTDLSGANGMTGPQGPKGTTGATGATGPKGDKGDTGLQGQAGVTPEFQIRNGILYAIYNE